MKNISTTVRAKLSSGLHQAVLTLLNEQYQFVAGDKVQNIFAEDLVSLVMNYWEGAEKLDPGQIKWLAAGTGEKPHYGKTARNTKFVPVTLTLLSMEDVEMMSAGFSEREVRERRIVRLFEEAFEQDALLTHSDVAALLRLSTGTVGKQLREYMEREARVVPTRGIIHDMGPSVTHKRIIIRLHLQGYQTPEIARMVDHTIEACDRYIKAYKRVRLLARKGMKVKEIAMTLGMGRTLVREYLKLYEEYENGGRNE